MSNRHWTEEEIEEAYRFWAWESKDSLRETSENLGIPERTVRSWSDRDGWRKRKLADQADLAEPAVGQATVLLKLGLSDAVTQLIADASNTKADHRDRLESQKLLFAMTLGSQFDLKQGSTFISLTEAKHIHLANSEPLSPGDLRRLASKAIEANVVQVDTGKAGRSGVIKH